MDFNIEQIEYLSKISMSGEEIESFKEKFSSTLDFVDSILQVDIPEEFDKDEPISLDDLRDDVAKESLGRDEALMNAPKEKDGCFVAPLVVE